MPPNTIEIGGLALIVGLLAFAQRLGAWENKHLARLLVIVAAALGIFWLVSFLPGYVSWPGSMLVVATATWPAKEWLRQYKDPGQRHPESRTLAAAQTGTLSSSIHGIIGDFTDISVEKADYGSSEIRKNALPGLRKLLADQVNRLPDGAICVPIRSEPLVGEDPHYGFYKHLRVTFSANLHENKPLTIRPGDRLLSWAGGNMGPQLSFEPVYSGDWQPEGFRKPIVVGVRNTQIALANKATNVTARVRFLRVADGTAFTVTQASWIWTKQTDAAHLRSIRSAVDLEGNESQPFVLISVRKDGGLCAESSGQPIGIIDTGKWEAQVRLISDNAEELNCAIGFTVLPDNAIKWDQPAFRKSS